MESQTLPTTLKKLDIEALLSEEELEGRSEDGNRSTLSQTREPVPLREAKGLNHMSLANRDGLANAAEGLQQNEDEERAVRELSHGHSPSSPHAPTLPKIVFRDGEIVFTSHDNVKQGSAGGLAGSLMAASSIPDMQAIWSEWGPSSHLYQTHEGYSSALMIPCTNDDLTEAPPLKRPKYRPSVPLPGDTRGGGSAEPRETTRGRQSLIGRL